MCPERTPAARLQAVLEELGLTDSTAGLLWALDPDDPPASMREVAHRLACDPFNVTLMSNRLEAAGLVSRLPHPADGRARLLALTDAGRQTRTALASAIVERTGVAALDARERQALRAALVKLDAGA